MKRCNKFVCFLMSVLLAAALFGAPAPLARRSNPIPVGSAPGTVEQAPPKPTTKPTLQRSPEDKETKPQESEVFRVDTNLVNVFFTAADKNRRFITTLGQQDIRVIEDGVPQEIFTFQRETERPLSIADSD